jgi:hypothetical protein
MAAGVGISAMTLRRASKSIGVVKQKAGMNGGWVWSLPKTIKPTEDGQQNCLITFGHRDHLREHGEVEEMEI